MLYLCCPYSHPDPARRDQRFRTSCRTAAKLMQAGIVVFNPLANSVPAVEFGGLELDHAGFMNIDLPILRRCDEVLVIGLSGWEESRGVQMEIIEALIQNIPITLISEKDIESLPAIPKTAQHFLESKIFTEVIEEHDGKS